MALTTPFSWLKWYSVTLLVCELLDQTKLQQFQEYTRGHQLFLVTKYWAPIWNWSVFCRKIQMLTRTTCKNPPIWEGAAYGDLPGICQWNILTNRLRRIKNQNSWKAAFVNFTFGVLFLYYIRKNLCLFHQILLPHHPPLHHITTHYAEGTILN